MKPLQCSSFQMHLHLLDFWLGLIKDHWFISNSILQLKSRCCITLFRAAAFVSPSPLSSSWWHPEFSQHSWWSPICSHPPIWPFAFFQRAIHIFMPFLHMVGVLPQASDVVSHLLSCLCSSDHQHPLELSEHLVSRRMSSSAGSSSIIWRNCLTFMMM